MMEYKSKTFYISRTNTPKCRHNKEGWLENHRNQCELIKSAKPKCLLIGDSIVKNLFLYPKIWKKYFHQEFMNCGISGDSTQHVLWRATNLNLPSTVKTVFVLVGTNNLISDSPIEIVNGIISIGLHFIKKNPDIQVLLSGILPRDSSTSNKRDIIEYVNYHIKMFCKNNEEFHYVDPGQQWINEDDSLRSDLFFHDKLHLIEKGYEKFSNIILKAIENSTSQSKSNKDNST